QDEHHSRHAEEHDERDEPAPPPFGSPETLRELADGGNRASDDDETAPPLAPLSDHPASSIGSAAPSDAARFSTTHRPATRTSMPLLRNVEYPSIARFTIGSPYAVRSL